MESTQSESTADHSGLELLTAEQLRLRLLQYRSEERTSLAQFLVHLGEVDHRSTYRISGQKTLWGFVRDELKFPECQTFLRTNAARVVHAYPEVVERILDGRLNLTQLAMLKNALLPKDQGPLAPEAARNILDGASNLSTRELRRFLAGLRAPTKRAPDGFRNAAPPTATVVAASDLALRADADRFVSAVVGPDGETTYVSVQAGKVVLLTGVEDVNKIVPIAGNQKEFVATVDGDEFENDLAELAFLSHSDPNDYLGMIQRAVKREIRRLKKKKGLDPDEAILSAQKAAKAAAAAVQPVQPPVEAQRPKVDLEDHSLTNAALAEIAERLGRVHIPVEVMRDVLRRAGFCCEGIGEDGRRCCSTRRCQFDHRKPVSLGGKTDSENLQILCERCNLMAARRILGDDWVDACIARDRARRAMKTQVNSPRAHEVN